MSASARQLVGMQRGTYGSGGEKLDWTYYDRFILDGTTPTLEHRLFTIPLGQAGKTLADTNLTQSGMIPQGQHFTVHALKPMILGITTMPTIDVHLLYTILERLTVEIILPGKDSMGTWTWQEIQGCCTMIDLTPTVPGDNIPLIQPRYHGIFPLNTPLTLAALTPFEVRCRHHAAPSADLDGMKFKLGLSGTLRRSS